MVSSIQLKSSAWYFFRLLSVIVMIMSLLLLLMYLRTPNQIAVHEIIPPSSASHFPICRKIPCIIHLSWKTAKLPERFQRLRNSWRRCFPLWEIKFWTDEDNRKLIAQHYPWFLKTYDKLPGNICRADISRYFYLFHFGGLYTDLDNECIRPFAHLLTNYSLVFGAMEGKSILPEGHTQNSFMYSTARHSFWLELINYVRDHPNAPPPGYLTGSDALMETIRSYRKRSHDRAKELKIYPAQYFNPFSWQRPRKKTACRTFKKMDNLESCRKEFPEAFVIQYHFHSWG